MQTGVYIGPETKLVGETAIVRDDVSAEGLLVQFSNVETGYGYGWHPFRRADFVVMEAASE